jgi:hypothetical protein
MQCFIRISQRLSRTYKPQENDEDGGGKFLRKVGTYLEDGEMSGPERPRVRSNTCQCEQATADAGIRGFLRHVTDTVLTSFHRHSSADHGL